MPELSALFDFPKNMMTMWKFLCEILRDAEAAGSNPVASIFLLILREKSGFYAVTFSAKNVLTCVDLDFSFVSAHFPRFINSAARALSSDFATSFV